MMNETLRYYKCPQCHGSFVQPRAGYSGPCKKCISQPGDPAPIQPASDLSAAMGRVVERAKARAFTVVELIFVLFIVSILALLAFDCHRRENEQMPSAFAAWEKQTGNEKHLTYDEWRALMRANEKKGDTTFIFIPQ